MKHERRHRAPQCQVDRHQWQAGQAGLKTTHNQLEPIGSMYAIDGNIHHQYTPNVAYIPAPWILWGMNMRPNRQLVKSPMSFDCFSGHRRNVPRKGKPYEGMDFS